MSLLEPLPFQIDVRAAGDTVIVALAGEFDAVVVGSFQTCIDAALTTSNTVVVDLADLSFIDSRGLHALLAAREAAQTAGRTLEFRDVSPAAARLIELVGVGELFGRPDTTIT